MLLLLENSLPLIALVELDPAVPLVVSARRSELGTWETLRLTAAEDEDELLVVGFAVDDLRLFELPAAELLVYAGFPPPLLGWPLLLLSFWPNRYIGRVDDVCVIAAAELFATSILSWLFDYNNRRYFIVKRYEKTIRFYSKSKMF